MSKRTWAEFFGFKKQPPPKKPSGKTEQDKFFASLQGGFEGARVDRTTEHWQPGNLSPDSIHRDGAAFLRQRARDLVINNPHAESAVRSYVSNVNFEGIAPAPKFQDRELRKKWVGHWNRFCKEADITGHDHLYRLADLWLEEVIVGGGCLSRYRNLTRREARGRMLPLAVELIPEERFAEDMDWRPPPRNQQNKIVRGVEINPFGRAVRFWITPHLPNDLIMPTDLEPVALPAEQCKYAFVRRRIGQHRGYSMFAAAIVWLFRLGYYLDSELIASAIRAAFAVAITREQHDDGDLSDEGDTSTDNEDNALEKLENAIIARLLPGESIQTVAPSIQGGDSTAWLELIGRSIAVGLGLSYEELMRDFTGGNFSTQRATSNADRRRFCPLQVFLINNFYEPLYERFVREGVLAGLDGFPTPTEFVSNPAEFLDVKWQRPGWPSVNPKEDVQAAVLAFRNRMGSRTDFVEARGKDVEETFDDIQLEEEGLAQRELESTVGDNNAADTAEASNEAAASNGKPMQTTPGKTE